MEKGISYEEAKEIVDVLFCDSSMTERELLTIEYMAAYDAWVARGNHPSWITLGGKKLC